MNDSQRPPHETPSPFPPPAPWNEPPIEAEIVDPSPTPLENPPQANPPRIRRRNIVAAVLFLATCLSTFFTGACQWLPHYYLIEALDAQSALDLRRMLATHWQDGLIYMACVLGILFAHEMGHFVATVYYKVRASLPFFLPFPITPVGTMGAVIFMDGRQADRKQIFDIGIAGPLAGLVVAIPVMWIGIQNLDLTPPEGGAVGFDTPLAVQYVFEHWITPPGYEEGQAVWISQMNPYYMAGWFGLLVTALNMIPVSQLDGGHVIYTIFGRPAGIWAAWLFMLAAMGYVVYMGLIVNVILMLTLILLIGVAHPPTRDDTVPLGWFRTALGLASLSIPILFFPPKIVVIG